MASVAEAEGEHRVRHRLQPVPVRNCQIDALHLVEIVCSADVDAVEILLGAVAEIADVPDLRPRTVELHVRSSRPGALPPDPLEGAFRRPQCEKENGCELQRRHHREQYPGKPPSGRQRQQHHRQYDGRRQQPLLPLCQSAGLLCFLLFGFLLF